MVLVPIGDQGDAQQYIVSKPPDKTIGTWTAKNQVIAMTTINPVIPISTVNTIVAAHATDEVITTEWSALQNITVGTNDIIVVCQWIGIFWLSWLI